jgi:ADP-heptose:LPS heptosyltransferase
MSPGIQILDHHEVPLLFDYHCPMMSLPLAFGTTLETIPSEQRYLVADEELRDAWRARLSPQPKPRIGIVWSGNPKPFPNRSIGLATLLPMLSADAHWIPLQKEIGDSDAALLRDLQIVFYGGEFRDFSDTAVLIDLVDLVITIDTSVAHLAGAMGKPVWIVLPYDSEWRWLFDRNDSPWYPSARLFRQHEIGNWAGVIEEVKSELRMIVG